MKNVLQKRQFVQAVGGVVSAFALFLMQGQAASGATYDWVGTVGGGDGTTYEVANNWLSNGVPALLPPANNLNTILRFGNGAAQFDYFVYLTGNKLVGQVIFDPHPNVDPYDIFGDDILRINTAGVGIQNNDVSLVTFDVRLQLLNSQTWAANAGPMQMNNEVNLAGRTLTINGAQPLTIAGPVVGASSRIVQAGPGLLTLAGNSTFDGGLLPGLTINPGRTVALGSDTGAGRSAIQINNGTLTITGGSRAVANDITGAGAELNVPAGMTLALSGLISAPTVLKTGTGNLALSANYSTFSTLTISAGRVALTGTGGNIIADTATVVLNNGTLDLLDKTEQFDTLAVGALGGALELQPDAIHGTLTLDDLTLSGALTIRGWLGSNMSPGTDDRIFINNFSGDQDDLALIYFDGIGWGGMFIGNELVPIPEPGTVALLALAGAALLGRRLLRRRN